MISMSVHGQPCAHPSDSVLVNICAADAVWRHTVDRPQPQTYNVQWCRLCGAYRVMFGDDEFGMEKPGAWELPQAART